MRNRLFSTTLLALFVVTLVALAPSTLRTELEIGTTAPMTDAKMMDVSEVEMSLADIAGEQGLLVVFSCATCPYVKAWEDRYLTAAIKAKELGIGMVAINPNEAYRNRGESLADMQTQAENNGYTFPYLLDTNHALADAFGATRTPHIFLFDNTMTLQYRGAIDDNAQSAEGVRNHYLIDAMQAMVAGEEIASTTTRSVGCSIKRI